MNSVNNQCISPNLFSYTKDNFVFNTLTKQKRNISYNYDKFKTDRKAKFVALTLLDAGGTVSADFDRTIVSIASPGYSPQTSIGTHFSAVQADINMRDPDWNIHPRAYVRAPLASVTTQPNLDYLQWCAGLCATSHGFANASGVKVAMFKNTGDISSAGLRTYINPESANYGVTTSRFIGTGYFANTSGDNLVFTFPAPVTSATIPLTNFTKIGTTTTAKALVSIDGGGAMTLSNPLNATISGGNTLLATQTVTASSQSIDAWVTVSSTQPFNTINLAWQGGIIMAGNANDAIYTFACSAGVSVPSLPRTSLTNVCPATTANLSTLTASNTPAGAALTWHTGLPASNANKISNPSAVSLNKTYYATFYDATNACYSAGSPVAVQVDSVGCTVVTPGAGTIDCAKTQLTPAPVTGTASKLVLRVTMNITTAGSFPVTVSGSGMSLADGYTGIVATTTGVQTFDIPLNYDGSTLGTLNFTITGAGSCTADLAGTAAKKAVIDIWTLEFIPTVGPGLK